MAADGTKATSKTDSVTQDDDTGWWIDGELLRFPGDPRASAHNVINCHCQVVTHVATNSPAMRKLRAENEAKRAEWVQQNKPHNKDDENWRRGSK